MAALMEMAEQHTDEENDECELREDGEVSTRNGESTDWATDRVEKAWETMMEEGNPRSESRASTRNTIQTTIPPTWSQRAGQVQCQRESPETPQPTSAQMNRTPDPNATIRIWQHQRKEIDGGTKYDNSSGTNNYDVICIQEPVLRQTGF